MTTRENQKRLDRLAFQYLQAIETEDFDTIEALWEQAADDPDLDEMLHGLNAELTAEQEAAQAAVASVVRDAIEQTMPSAELDRPASGPPTVAEVAEHIRRHPPAGLTLDDLRINDALRKVIEPVPEQLGISQVLHWGEKFAKFGPAPDAYWRAFREAALDLCMRRAARQNYKMAARPQRPQSRRPAKGSGNEPGGKPGGPS